ncbi:MAG: helix-turn-helix domain-containing protein [Solirubrobacterales bacterium]|nr:helix-turn-helix domain-containing protein [Solirubrobacterales bacterium]
MSPAGDRLRRSLPGDADRGLYATASANRRRQTGWRWKFSCTSAHANAGVRDRYEIVPLRLADSNHDRTTRESQRTADERRRCGYAEGLRPERVDQGGHLGATSRGAERSRDRSPARAWAGDRENHLRATGGIRPRARKRPERCLSVAEREEISRGIARGHSARTIARALRRSHTAIAREINRCGGRRRYRAHAADREAARRRRRPRPTKIELVTGVASASRAGAANRCSWRPASAGSPRAARLPRERSRALPAVVVVVVPPLVRCGLRVALR